MLNLGIEILLEWLNELPLLMIREALIHVQDWKSVSVCIPQSDHIISPSICLILNQTDTQCKHLLRELLHIELVLILPKTFVPTQNRSLNQSPQPQSPGTNPFWDVLSGSLQIPAAATNIIAYVAKKSIPWHPRRIRLYSICLRLGWGWGWVFGDQ